MERLPNMKAIRHLSADREFFNENDRGLMMAFRQNPNLVKLAHPYVAITAPMLLVILKRNKLVARIGHYFLGRNDIPLWALAMTTTTTTADIGDENDCSIYHSTW
jgi:hypothetical protein